jgi:hypothetical protein
MARKPPITEVSTAINQDIPQESKSIEEALASQIAEQVDIEKLSRAVMKAVSVRLWDWFLGQSNSITPINEIEAMAISGGDDENP